MTDPDARARSHLRLVGGALTRLTDEELMERHRDGEDGCFAVLVERYKGRIFSFLRRMGFNHARAEELTADTFLKVHRAAARYTPSAKFSTYLYTVARRAGLNARDRMATRYEFATGGVELEVEPARAPDAERQLAARRSVELLQRELERLPAEHQDAFNLYYAQGLSCAEVAEILGITAAEAKGRLAYARKLLRQRLAGLVPEADPSETPR